MTRNVFVLLLFVTPFLSCQREQDWDGAPDINAKVESEQKTRTSISVDESGSGTIYWNPSDRIDVFFGTKKAQYTSQNASDAIAATFKTSDSVSGSDVSSTNIWGLYPSNSSSSCNGSSITTTLPSTQYGVPNTFDKDIFPAVAHSSSTNLQFYNVCGGIKFNMAYDDIKKVTFKGNNNENIAGTVSITFTSGVPQATVTSGVKQITLNPKSGSTFTKGTDYYITLLPGTLSKGFTMTFTATDGTVGTLNYTDASVTIKRSIFSRKGNMDVYAAFGDGRQPNNVIYYTSTDGSIVTPCYSDRFGVTILSNECIGGKGILLFDGSVTQIGDNAFSNCDNLVSISLPESVTSIGRSVFTDCSNLVSVFLPNGVTTMGDLVFHSCSSLQNVSIPEGVTRIGESAFYRCTSLSSLIIPDGVTSIGQDAFGSCSSLASINIPDGVTSIEMLVFAGCSSLTSIDIPDGVTLIGGYAFSGCSALTGIEVPSSVLSIGDYAFSGCTSLATLTLNDGLESIGDASFDRCSSLSNIIIPSSVTSISERAFRSCSGLQSITVLNPTPPSIGATSLSNTNNCPIYVPAESVNAYKSAWSRYADRIQAIPDTHEAVDLGLSVKWATCNVGADSPEGYGNYFAWGETESKSDYSWSTYEWCNGSNSTLTKYCNNSSYGYNGFTDNKTVLDLEDDAAHVNWGGSWRMPTDAEWTELRQNCTWTRITQNGVNGYRVTSKKTGYTDKSIFLPAAGYRVGTYLYDEGTRGGFWSSSLYTDHPNSAWSVIFVSGVGGYDTNRFSGFSVRPVYGDFISVENISLNKSSLSITEGETSQLSATVSPSTATAKTVSWSSSNTNVATVSSEGVVTAVSAGTATITAWASDGEHFATCSVTVQAPTTGTENGHDWVDLGLPSGVKWATCNVGASSPEEYGDYFAWGETEAKTDYSWSTYRWCNGSETTLTKYNTKSNYGTVDNKTVLDLSDDAARANWGGSWRMPTDAEWTELRTRCVWTWTTLGGKNGYNVRGPNGNTIFLPAAGKRFVTSLYYAGSLGDYWSSSLYTGYPNYALDVSFGSSNVNGSNYYRFYGQSVRPVYGDFISVESISLNKSSLTIMRGETSQLSATVSPSTATAKTHGHPAIFLSQQCLLKV